MRRGGNGSFCRALRAVVVVADAVTDWEEVGTFLTPGILRRFSYQGFAHPDQALYSTYYVVIALVPEGVTPNDLLETSGIVFTPTQYIVAWEMGRPDDSMHVVHFQKDLGEEEWPYKAGDKLYVGLYDSLPTTVILELDFEYGNY